MLVSSFQLTSIAQEFFVVIRVSNLLKRAANYSLRFRMLSGSDYFESIVGCDVNISSHEIHEVCALQEQLSQPGIVVVSLRNVTVAAGLCFSCSDCMGNMCIERLSSKSFRRRCLLLRVNPLAVLILRTN